MSFDANLLNVFKPTSGAGGILKDLAARFERRLESATGAKPPATQASFSDVFSEVLENKETDDEPSGVERPKYAPGTDVSEIEKDYAKRWDQLTQLERDWLTKPLPGGMKKSPLPSAIQGGKVPNVTVKFTDIPGSAEWLKDYDAEIPPDIRAVMECPGATCIQMPADYNPALYRSWE